MDTQIDDELEGEGFVRDLIRQVQDERKAAGLHVADRIKLTVTVPAERVSVVEKHADMLKAETLTLDLTVEAGDEIKIHVVKMQ